MDKPLSQERLSEDDLAELIDDMEFSLGVAIASPNGLRGITAEGAEAMLKALYEVKRLQAIESSSFDMYKTALEIIATSDDPYYIGRVTHRKYARNILNIGDDDHESN